jgi:two-component system, cell cycle sensor histidine kinase and response regulator CckA
MDKPPMVSNQIPEHSISKKNYPSHQEIKTILLMDDEVDFLEIFSQILLSLDFNTVCMHNGSDLLHYFSSKEAAAPAIAAMFFDLTIPGEMGGKETIAEVRKIDKNIPVFVTSGYSDDPVMVDPQKFGFTASIVKPFRIQDLSELLTKHLSTPAEPI